MFQLQSASFSGNVDVWSDLAGWGLRNAIVVLCFGNAMGMQLVKMMA